MSDAADTKGTASSTSQKSEKREEGFLEERPSHDSAMRAMCAAAFLCAVEFGIVTLVHPEVEETVVAYVPLGGFPEDPLTRLFGGIACGPQSRSHTCRT